MFSLFLSAQQLTSSNGHLAESVAQPRAESVIMAGDKGILNGSSWKGRFGKKSSSGDTLRGRDDPLAEAMHLEKPRPRGSQSSNSNPRAIPLDPYIGIVDEREMAAQHIARQQHRARSANISRADGQHSSPTALLDDYRVQNGAVSPRGKMERLLGESTDGVKLTAHRGSSMARSASSNSYINPPETRDMSRSSSSQHINTEETSCPVCLELLSFRLAGEKPHVTPICGHALHHACFTAVYGSPEAVLAAQSKSGKGVPPPGMCGVCRNLIVLGEDGEGRRQDKLAGMMGISQGSQRQRGASGPSRSVSEQEAKTSFLDDDPADSSLRETNERGSGFFLSNHGRDSVVPSAQGEDALSHKSMRGALYPTIRVRAEHGTIYRKRRNSKDEKTKQNVVCVVSVEVPSRRIHEADTEQVEDDADEWENSRRRNPRPSSNSDGDETYDVSLEDHSASQSSPEYPSEYNSVSSQQGEKLAKEKEAEADDEAFSYSATPSAATMEKLDPFANVVEDLRWRISDWKGHTVDRFGPLVLYDFLGVQQESAVREFYVFLFKEAILCVTEERRKDKSAGKPRGQDRTSNGGQSISVTSENDKSVFGTKPGLKLKGRIWLRHIKSCDESDGEANMHNLGIKLEDETLDRFVLCFKEVGHRKVWKDKITELLGKEGSVENVLPAAPSLRSLRDAPLPSIPQEDPREAEEEGIEGRARLGNSRRNTDASNSGHSVQSGKAAGSHNQGQDLSAPSAVPRGLAPTGKSGSIRGKKSSDMLAASNSGHVPAHPNTARRIYSLDKTPRHQQWSSSGGLNPALSAPELLPHTPIDLVIMISVPSLGLDSLSSSPQSTTAALKLNLIRSTLDFIVSHLGSSDRLALVAYSVGADGPVKRTSLLSTSKEASRETLDSFVDSLGKPWKGPGKDPFQDDGKRLGGNSERTDTVTAVNIGLDIVLQRKIKNPVTGMLLISDTADTPRRGQMDLVMARAEAANVPVHCFGFGKGHDPSSLWLLANHTRGSYTFVREWYQLKECMAGCIGSLMSVALTQVKLHISVPSDNCFRVRKVTGATGAIVSTSGKDIDVELGELRFGDCKELFVELELDFDALVKQYSYTVSGQSASDMRKKVVSTHYEKGSATDDFMQQLGLQGLSLSTSTSSDANTPAGSNDHSPLDSIFIEEVAVLQVDCGCRDPSTGSSISRLPMPKVLTLEVDGFSPDPLGETSSAGQATALADPVVTRRRLEILVSDMITRSLLLVSRRNESQALTLLLETRRIIDTVLQAIPNGEDTSSTPLAGALRQSQSKKSRELLHRKTVQSLTASLNDLDVLIDGLESNRGTSFDRVERNFGAQQAMILRDQKAWTSRTDSEWQFHRYIDNAAPFAALAAYEGTGSRS